MFDAQEFQDHHVYRPLIPPGANVNNQHPGAPLEVILEISESGEELEDDGGRNGDEADDELSVQEGHDDEPGRVQEGHNDELGRVQEDSEGGQSQESQESARDEVDSRSSQDWEKLSVRHGTFLHYLDVSI